MASGSKFVQITKEIVNIRAITDPTEAEDNETVHGFIENRTVFGASGELVQYSTIVINRLMTILLFPIVLNACEDLDSVIVPDYTLDQIKDNINSLLNSSNVSDSDYNWYTRTFSLITD